MEYSIPKQYRLQVKPGENGSVTSSAYDLYQNDGSTVTLTAVPNAGYKFAGWNGDVTSTDATINVKMDSHKHINAAFTSIATGAQSIETKNQNHFICYPTITSGLLTARWEASSNSSSEISISDLNGKEYTHINDIKTFSGSNDYELDISCLSPGMYICKLLSDKNISTLKVIKF
jgi:uncharacterized repeat protein (TIGR02543 family)